ncbi:hypothetical protein [Eoetvoesiella caeni]|uniref:Helix-turn-helix protein n=2 Tax=Eoetvoesiella caeni TaxID=645616 RepID=A0A366H966_9BURK|nr:hypothetical protein [Eoetvoesiella caeni]MCI2809531.1 hypothetical protein [Eoetvoesiella caeni]RBP38790.1 hypothetical protein DFR37_10682 [Eoetvoesiella caeni]
MAEKKKSPEKGAVAGRRTANSTPIFTGTRSPRHVRVLQALMVLRKLTREELDRVAGASNGPDVVRQLRGKGLAVPCNLLPRIDRDGRPCEVGEYSLTPADRRAIVGWLKRQMLVEAGS